MIQSDEQLVTTLVDAQPYSVIWFKPVFNQARSNHSEVTDFEVRYCNTAACELLSTKKEVLVGQVLHSTNLLDKASVDLIYSQCLKVWQTGQQEQFIYYNQYLGRYFNVLRSKIVDGVISVTRDFTREVEAEETAKKQAELLNSILDASINAVFACEAIRNQEGNITDFKFRKFNKRFLEITGRKEKELINGTYLTCFPQASELFKINCRVIETCKPVRMEHLYESNRVEAWFDISMVKLGEDGVVITFSDISDTKADKEKILSSSQHLQNAIDSSQTGITVIIPEYNKKGELIDFRYKVVNQTFSTYIGRSPSEMVGQRLIDMFPSYKAQGTFDRYKQIYKTGEPQRFDLHYVKDGYDVWIDIMAKKVGHEIFVTFHDYTPLKKAQLQLESMVKDLRMSNTNLETFAYAASHDLQEPLRKINFFADKIKRMYSGTYNEEGIAIFERMEGAILRMRELIDDLLTYSQINVKAKEEKEVDLNDVLQDVLNDLETTIHEKNARITSGILPIVIGDKPQIGQLFQNLLSNALKYVYPDRIPFISITSRLVLGTDSGFTIASEKLQLRYYLIHIADNGIGFEQEDSERIFNVFQRLHGRSEYAGTGVGLAIVKKVIDNHNGAIMAYGKPGEGSTFSFLLPES
jgi:signal transduction histidine kinase